MIDVDATGEKTNGKKEVRVDVTKRKSTTTTMTGRKVTGKKQKLKKRQGKSQQPEKYKTEELI